MLAEILVVFIMKKTSILLILSSYLSDKETAILLFLVLFSVSK